MSNSTYVPSYTEYIVRAIFSRDQKSVIKRITNCSIKSMENLKIIKNLLVFFFKSNVKICSNHLRDGKIILMLFSFNILLSSQRNIICF